MEAKGLARVLQAPADPMEPHKGWSMIPHNSVIARDSSELWRSNTIHTINHIKKRMVGIFQEYPDLYTEMIEEKRDAEMLTLFKSMKPQIPDVKVKPTVSAEVPKKSYSSDGKSKFLYPHY
ncbi:uncharacterized protein LOC134816577 [Bolinopsis microptera]|uniref:uncharacterized protein LOC134816577 n=1 Tax=Bolinopsis microptera TaxID=2820187 RepID=UPI0030792044